VRRPREDVELPHFKEVIAMMLVLAGPKTCLEEQSEKTSAQF
jgi:hypothetical protein